jgi:hypothetical protein
VADALAAAGEPVRRAFRTIFSVIDAHGSHAPAISRRTQVSLTVCKWAWANMAGIPEWANPAEILHN